MADKIDNTEDILTNRQVIERIGELTEWAERIKELEAQDRDARRFPEREAEPLTVEEMQELDDTRDLFDDDAQKELKALEALAADAENYARDWYRGSATLIREDHFVDYAREFAEEQCGEAPGWPFNHVDWEAAARELRMDWQGVDFDGVTYYVR